MTDLADLSGDVVELAPWIPPAQPAPAPQLREVAFHVAAWLPEEDATLRRMFADDAPIAEIAETIGRPFQGTRARITALGLRRNSARQWLPEEEAELLARYGTEPCATIAQDLGRSVAATYGRAQVLSLSGEIAPDWSDWEDAQLRAGYERGVPVGQLAVLIGRPLLGARSRATILGLRHPSQPPGWSDEEIDRALALAETGLPYRDIVRKMRTEGYPERSTRAFGLHVRKLGYGRGWGRNWTADEEELLRRAYATGGSLVQLAGRMGRGRSSVMWKAGELGLHGTHPDQAGWRRGRCWTEADEAVLRAEYGKTPNRELARKLDREWSAIRVRANHLGLQHGWMRAFSADEDRALAIAWRQGLSIVDVAAAMNRDPSVIGKRIRRVHGLAFSDPDRPTRGPRTRKVSRAKLTLAKILALEPEDA